MFPADQTDSPGGIEKLPEPLMLAIFQPQPLQVLAFLEVPALQSPQRSKIWALTAYSRHPGAFPAPGKRSIFPGPHRRGGLRVRGESELWGQIWAPELERCGPCARDNYSAGCSLHRQRAVAPFTVISGANNNVGSPAARNMHTLCSLAAWVRGPAGRRWGLLESEKGRAFP